MGRKERIMVYGDYDVDGTTAVLGGEIKIHTLYGDVVCKIKPGTQSQQEE